MQFETWEPVYEAILADFGFDRGADERARDVLADLADPFDPERLPAFSGATVAVAGAGPSLENELKRAREADVVVAASTAVDRLEEREVGVDCMVTDLDKNPDTVRRLTKRETPVAVHAHGDNIDAVQEVVPDCAGEFVLPTTQAEPRSPVENFGGFTDGDRAAFLADHFRAARLEFVGWDLDDSSVDPTKAKKLEWAGRLLVWLEIRRGERFSALDGSRSRYEPPG